MGKHYKWNENYLKNKIKDLTALLNSDDLNNKQKHLIKDTVAVYDGLLWFFYGYSNNVTENELFSHNKSKSSEKKVPIYLDENMITIIDEISSLTPISIPHFKQLEYSDFYIVKHIKQFYQQLDNDIFKLFSHIENQNPSLYHFAEYCNTDSFCLFDRYYRLPYVFISKQYNIIDMHDSVHEIGHAIDMTCNKFENGYRIIDEVFPYLMEFLFADYCINNGYHAKQNSLAAIMNYDEIIYYAQQVNDELKKTVFTVDKIRQNNNQINLPFYCIPYIRYIFSFVIATEIYDQYIHDSKGTLENIKTFLNRNNNNSIKEVLRSINVKESAKLKLKIHLQK